MTNVSRNLNEGRDATVTANAASPHERHERPTYASNILARRWLEDEILLVQPDHSTCMRDSDHM